MKHIVLLIISFTGTGLKGFAQQSNHLTFSGYAEIYYVYDFNKPSDNVLPDMVYSYNRHNEINLNLGLIKASYNTERTRANFALMAGTYANANLAAEPGVLKNIYESNIGLKISSKKNLWIDAGIFSSHIGFESAIGKDCWTLTRSMLADNSPYYEAGAKVSYTSDNGKWFLSGLLLNGWQRIQRVDGNSLPSFGTQITFKPASTITLNSSTFIGTDKPDSVRQMRYFHNFYGIFKLSDKFDVIVGVDNGAEERFPKQSSMNLWHSPVIILKYTANEKLSVSVRGEYYDDQQGVIIKTDTPHGFQTSGVSANIDWHITNNIVWRTEVKSLTSRDNIFKEGDVLSKNNSFAGSSLAVNFQ